MNSKWFIRGFLVVLLGCGYFAYHRYQQREAISAALAYGRLAVLPAGVEAVQVDTEGGMFSRTFWLTFRANPATIRQWIARCPSLVKQQPSSLPAASVSVGAAPGWFAVQGIKKGSLYQIPWNQESLYGTVWIDYETGTVYIKTSHS